MKIINLAGGAIREEKDYSIKFKSKYKQNTKEFYLTQSSEDSKVLVTSHPLATDHVNCFLLPVAYSMNVKKMYTRIKATYLKEAHPHNFSLADIHNSYFSISMGHIRNGDDGYKDDAKIHFAPSFIRTTEYEKTYEEILIQTHDFQTELCILPLLITRIIFNLNKELESCDIVAETILSGLIRTPLEDDQ